MTLPAAVNVTAENPGVALAERYTELRWMTESLAKRLTPEDQMLQSMPDASPVKWHLAHTTWFFETFLLIPNLAGYEQRYPEFTYLFNSYYNAVGERPERPNRGLMSRPALQQVLAYRSDVDAAMQRLMENSSASEIDLLVELGINHEQQHQELIVTDIKHAFWTQPLRPAYAERAVAPPERAFEDAGEMQWVSFPGGIYSVGHTGDGFAFDNETPRHHVLLQPFSLGSRLITNREYLEFMRDGGYLRPEFWLSEGWEMVRNSGWQSPLFWVNDGDWKIFTAAGVTGLRSEEPVCHISYYEADAYARWSGARLATEFEWEVASGTTTESGAFLESERFHPAPVDSLSMGLKQMFGDCWEWTASPYIGYPGYSPRKGALGEYNGKFMCNQIVLRGGSCATPRSHIRASYRNFFPAHARWQFSGIRLAR